MNLRRILFTFLTCILIAGIDSCTYESPEINFHQTTTNDFAKIIEAIESQTKTVAEKLALLEAAVNNQTLDFSAKLALIEASVKAGFLDQKNTLGFIKDALVALNSAVAGMDDIIGDIVNAIDKVKTAIDGVDNTLKNKIDAALKQIFSAVTGIVIPDYESLLQSIKNTIEEIKNDIPTELGRINGHLYVEMGDGLKWATCNIGASKPQEYGYFFAWGETDAKQTYSWETYQFAASGTMESIYKYTIPDGKNNCAWYDSNNNFIGDNLTQLVIADDAAYVNWGGTWRMPTVEEWRALLNKDNFTWTYVENYKGEGIAGMMVTSKIEGYKGNSIFLPGAGYRDYRDNQWNVGQGYYWSSSLYLYTDPITGESLSNTFQAYCVGFWRILVGSSIRPMDGFRRDRNYGHSIRAVSE